MTTKKDYLAIRESIRDNGLRYTAQHAADTNNINALTICDKLANIMKSTDWLAMRKNFARSEKPAIAFKLTSTLIK